MCVYVGHPSNNQSEVGQDAKRKVFEFTLRGKVASNYMAGEYIGI
jgi:hypothetical protein